MHYRPICCCVGYKDPTVFLWLFFELEVFFLGFVDCREAIHLNEGSKCSQTPKEHGGYDHRKDFEPEPEFLTQKEIFTDFSSHFFTENLEAEDAQRLVGPLLALLRKASLS